MKLPFQRFQRFQKLMSCLGFELVSVSSLFQMIWDVRVHKGFFLLLITWYILSKELAVGPLVKFS